MTTIRFLLLSLLTLAASDVHAQRLVAWPIALPIHRPPVELPRPLPAPLVIPPEAKPLPIVYRGLAGTITDDLARLTMEVRFRNDTRGRLEGELFVPVPKDAVFDSLEMEVGGKIMRAELLEANAARSTYEAIVRQMRDPALLELVNDRLMRCRVFPIEPSSEVKLRFSYVQQVPKEGNLRTLRVPVVKFSDRGMKQDQRILDLSLTASKPLRLLYSPSHRIETKRHGDRAATVWYGGETGLLEKDLVLLYSIEDGPLSVSVSAHRTAGEPGTFLLTMDPRSAPGASALPKDLVFVLDRSASMEDDGKLKQLKAAMAHGFERLSPEDRFTIVDFGTGVETLSETLLPANGENLARAAAYVKGIEATGATNIEGALQLALTILKKSPGRLPLVVFVTDGRPTVGETGVDPLLKSFADRRAASGARFFGLGIGPDVNTALIDRLADSGKGVRDYVLPGEDLETKAARFFERIGKPALTDVKVEWKGGGVHETYPRETSDVYYGDPLVLAGRFSGTGKASLVVTGRSGAREVRYEIPVELPAAASGNAFLPRLWAHRKVAQMIDDVRLSGKVDPAASEEIMQLARRYGIVTPYTSFLIAEDRDLDIARRRTESGLAAMAADAAGAGGGGASLRAMSMSREMAVMKSAAYAPASAPEGERRDSFRAAGAKTFYRKAGLWTDSTVDEKDAERATEVEAYGPRFFELLKEFPELREYMTGSGDVLVVLGGKTYRIKETR